MITPVRGKRDILRERIQILWGYRNVVFGCVPHLSSLRLLYNPQHFRSNCQLPSACTLITSDFKTHQQKHTPLYSHRVLCACLQRRGMQQRSPGARSRRHPEQWSGSPPCPGQRGRSPPGAQRVPRQAAGSGRRAYRSRAAELPAPAPWPQPPRDGADSRHSGGERGARTPEATRAEQNKTRPHVLPLNPPLTALRFSSLVLQWWTGLLVWDRGILQIPCILLSAGHCMSYTLSHWNETKERNERGGATWFSWDFFFLKNNPVIWSLIVSLEISSIKALFCLPKEFFQLWPHLPHRDSLPCIISSF